MHWLKISSWLLKARHHQSMLQEPQPLDLAQAVAPRLPWCQKELALLLSAQQSGRPCYAERRGSDLTMQSLILGFDVDSNQLLLDEFVPSPAAGVIDRQLTVHLASSTAVLQLQVLVTGRVRIGAHAALATTVLCKSFVDGPKSEPSVVFNRQQAPAIDLLLPMNPLLRGQVLELSSEKLLISAPVTDRPSLYTRNGQCRIRFAEQFSLQCAVKIKSLRFVRKPSRHSIVHASFEDLTKEQTEQLTYFTRQLRSSGGQNPQAA